MANKALQQPAPAVERHSFHFRQGLRQRTALAFKKVTGAIAAGIGYVCAGIFFTLAFIAAVIGELICLFVPKPDLE